MVFSHLFVDMNSYFASVEQQERPELRGRPVGVVQVKVDTTCCIAASYEAKAFGVKTGTLVREARELCPSIQFVEARHELYVKYHHAIVEAVGSCLPVEAVYSVDEMSCRLIGSECEPGRARGLAMEIKAAIARRVGQHTRCSIGLGPSVFLAKIAADLRKPDGLSEIPIEKLPGALHALELTDLPGIGPRMARRLAGQGVTTTAQLCALPEARLCELWGSRVMGGQWWRRLRGENLPVPTPPRRSVGHSRVLPPELRTHDAARQTLICMTHQAAERLRKYGRWAREVSVSVAFAGSGGWSDHCRIAPYRDTQTLLGIALELWSRCPRQPTPIRIAVVLGDLAGESSVTPPLLDCDQRRNRLSDVLDRLNTRYGPHTLYFGAMHGAAGRIPLRIAFNHVPELPTPARVRRSGPLARRP